MKNKKAQVGESLQDIVGLVVIAFLLIIFFFLSSTAWGFSQKEIKEVPTKQSIQDQEHVSLYNFLQKQVIITKGTESQTITIAEIVKLSEIDAQYQTILDNEANSAFGSNYEFKITVPEDPYGSIFYLPSNEIIFVKLTKK